MQIDQNSDKQFSILGQEEADSDTQRELMRKCHNWFEDHYPKKVSYIGNESEEEEQLILFMFEKGQGMQGLAAMVKAKDQEITKKDEKALKALNDRNYRCVVVYSLQGFNDALKFHLKQPIKPKPAKVLYKKSTLRAANKSFQAWKKMK